jgi:TolB-like protein
MADKPSIAVLPFNNLSGDPEQDFIGDWLTEDVIAGISCVRTFFVIARNSTFQYKGTSPDIRQVAEELGVRYVVEGSVRKAENRIRVTVQLIDALNNNHLWAEKYDREFEDIFDVQDEVTRAIVGRLEPEFDDAEYERVKSQPPEKLGAWELYHRAIILFYHRNEENKGLS